MLDFNPDLSPGVHPLLSEANVLLRAEPTPVRCLVGSGLRRGAACPVDSHCRASVLRAFRTALEAKLLSIHPPKRTSTAVGF